MSKTTLPDIQKQDLGLTFESIDWVGMEDISLPLSFQDFAENISTSTKVDAMVNLISGSQRGIHMSRLYLLVQNLLRQGPVSLLSCTKITKEFIESQKGLSDCSLLRIRADIPISRPALKSDNTSFKNYPIEILVLNLRGDLRIFCKVEVLYSSTCPASAALARQLIQAEFSKKFGGADVENRSPLAAAASISEIEEWLGTTKGIVATPHAQRSLATVQVEVAETSKINFVELIDLVEGSLQTPVQGAVKRVDEQEFALRNGQNLMFCEDAARRVRETFEAQKGFLDFYAKLIHFESLHQHNAVSYISAKKKMKNFL